MSNKQVTLDSCVSSRLRDRLRKASIIASRTGTPVVLYRNTIEEVDHAAEEEIATVNEQYVVVQVITHGGFIPPNFQQQFVFTLDKFPEWIMNRSNELVARCLETLDEQIID
ncbi:MAG: hypothetical protein ABI361_10535 [Nitrososphaera sp.]